MTPSPGLRQAHKVRVLLVRAPSADRELMKLRLEAGLWGAVVDTAATMAKALTMPPAFYDVVILELSVADRDGVQMMAPLRELFADRPVLVVTPRGDDRFARSALAAGADDCIVDGSDVMSLATTVQYAVHRYASSRELRHFASVAQGLLDATEAPSCVVDGEGQIIAVSRDWSALAGASGDLEASAIGLPYLQVSENAGWGAVATGAQLAEGLSAVLAGSTPQFERDFVCGSPGEERWFSLRINGFLGAPGAVVTHRDVTAARRTEAALLEESLHDPLTRLPNRSLLNDRLSRSLVFAGRHGGEVVVALIDLDHFSRINSSLGHAAGDALLRQVAARLAGKLEGLDTVSRFAGDEFVVVWPVGAGRLVTEQLGELLSEAFDTPFVVGDTSLVVTASIGMAMGASPHTADDLLLDASAAKAAVKVQGGAGVRMYDEGMRGSSNGQLRLENELREALAGNQFVLHYQPIMDLRTQAVSGVEALVRWEHPDGLRMPDSFIPVAESSGLIVPLGAWVLREACRQAAAWAAAGLKLDVSVNLSMRQVSHPDILTTICDVLSHTGLPPERLMVEVTETAVAGDSEAVLESLTRIVALGVQVAIDDFGTGYCSLLYLKRYPLNALKVDRSFVAGMGLRADDDAIVASVIRMAAAVNAVCIAEGVETYEQLSALQMLGCHFAQGYLFSRPVAAEQLPAWVDACDERWSSEQSPRGFAALAAPRISPEREVFSPFRLEAPLVP